jgi:hypothetical protein
LREPVLDVGYVVDVPWAGFLTMVSGALARRGEAQTECGEESGETAPLE